MGKYITSKDSYILMTVELRGRFETELSKGDGYYFMASPYTAEEEYVMKNRYDKALEALTVLTKQGYVVFSPIVHSHPQAERYGLGRDSITWRKINDVMLTKSDGLIILRLDGWKNSKGIKWEITAAEQLGKPVYYLDPIMT